MKAHILQHVPFEGLGSMEPWLRGRGAELSYTRFFESAALPEVDGLDLLIIMGGPMSANDEAALPWLVAEKQFIRQAVAAGVAVLGVCLGAQLIASALGEKVYKNTRREIGWFDIEAVPGEGFQFPPVLKVFHWHGETFDLPKGALQLARSDACENQAFQLGSSVIGLQFHLETTPQSAEAIITHCRGELVEEDFVQSEAALHSVAPSAYQHINECMGWVLDYLCRGRAAA